MNEVTETTNNLPTEQDDWGQDDVQLKTSQRMISKLLPMQGLSKLVAARKAVIGEYRDSVTGELLGNIDDKEPLQFIPVRMMDLWTVNVKKNGGWSFYGIEEATPDLEYRHKLPRWQEEKVDPKDGQKKTFQYIYDITFFIILVKDAAEGNPKPYTLSFRSKSLKGGKKLATQMYETNRNQKLSPAAYVMNLEGRMDSNEKGSFVVIDVSLGRRTTKEENLMARDLNEVLKDASARAKVDHSDISDDYSSDNEEF